MKKTGNSRIDGSTARWVVGSDEAGYGAWAGPLLVAAVAALRDWEDPRVTDSKAVSERKREALFDEFRTKAAKDPNLLVTAVAVPPEVIDQKGVYQAVIDAHIQAIQSVLGKLPLDEEPLIVADGTLPLEEVGAICLPKADAKVPAVSLASIFAKVARDRIMRKAGEKYPGYKFGVHKGYGTKVHQEALRRLGVCPIHRKSYRPVAKVLNRAAPDDKFPWEID